MRRPRPKPPEEGEKVRLSDQEYEEIYNHFQWLARRHAKGGEPGDLASQFFLEYLEHGYNLEVLSKEFRAFVKLRCLREMTKAQRRRQREMEVEDEVLFYLQAKERCAPSPEEILIEKERAEMLRSLLRRVMMIPRFSILVRLLIEGKTRREIAEAMQISVGGVQNEIARLTRTPQFRSLVAAVKSP